MVLVNVKLERREKVSGAWNNLGLRCAKQKREESEAGVYNN